MIIVAVSLVVCLGLVETAYAVSTCPAVTDLDEAAAMAASVPVWTCNQAGVVCEGNVTDCHVTSSTQPLYLNGVLGVRRIAFPWLRTVNVSRGHGAFINSVRDLSVLEMPALEQVFAGFGGSALYIGNCLIQEASFPALRTLLVNGGGYALYMYSNGNLLALRLPFLERAESSFGSGFYLWNNARLDTIEVPRLASIRGGSGLDALRFSLMPALQAIAFPALASVTGGGRLKLDTLYALRTVDFAALERVDGDFQVLPTGGPINECSSQTGVPLQSVAAGLLRSVNSLDIDAGGANNVLTLVNMSSLEQVGIANGYLFVSRCDPCLITGAIRHSNTTTGVARSCSVGRGNVLHALAAPSSMVACAPCAQGTYSAGATQGACAACGTGLWSVRETSTCFSLDFTVPRYACVGSVVNATSRFQGGEWSILTPQLLANISVSDDATVFTVLSLEPGVARVEWRFSGSQQVKTVEIVGPRVAEIPALDRSRYRLCGQTGTLQVGVLLSGDAAFGLWDARIGPNGPNPPTFGSPTAAYTTLTWYAAGAYTLRFAPNSSCSTPVTRELLIDVECPPEPLSEQAKLGIAIGATLGAVILACTAVYVSVWGLRTWNRNKVKLNRELFDKADARPSGLNAFYSFGSETTPS